MKQYTYGAGTHEWVELTRGQDISPLFPISTECNLTEGVSSKSGEPHIEYLPITVGENRQNEAIGAGRLKDLA